MRKRQAIPIPAPACMEEENRQRRQRDAAEAAAIAKSKAAAAEYDRKIEQQRADTCGRSPRTRQAILQHKPIIGMTADEARCALDGQFIHVNRTTSVYGVSEQWVIGRGSDTQYLYFNNGILTTIQD
ncbi:hypothetical protein C7443_101478 [Plasticicumulans acidivorans]|uniref:Uncharacterized protein n=1 Tax=Plasticicumulans acidivorans TaxID=886464 RepID=A0A317N1I1_9GAMM|nr:hypothetical protein C7443_101478 [Plasticicumulans acidivorans]